MEEQFSISLTLIPDTGVVNHLSLQVLIPLIHQILTTYALYKCQAIASICIAFAQSRVVETTIQWRVICYDRKGRSTDLTVQTIFKLVICRTLRQVQGVIINRNFLTVLSGVRVIVRRIKAIRKANLCQFDNASSAISLISISFLYITIIFY